MRKISLSVSGTAAKSSLSNTPRSLAGKTNIPVSWFERNKEGQASSNGSQGDKDPMNDNNLEEEESVVISDEESMDESVEMSDKESMDESVEISDEEKMSLWKSEMRKTWVRMRSLARYQIEVLHCIGLDDDLRLSPQWEEDSVSAYRDIEEMTEVNSCRS